MEQQTEQNNLVYLLVGREMSSVEFVRDYVQLRFDGMTLTLFNYPLVIVNGTQYNIDTFGFRDCLCSLINAKVISIEIDREEAMRILFNNSSILLVLINNEKYDGPEIALLTTENNQIQVR